MELKRKQVLVKDYDGKKHTLRKLSLTEHKDMCRRLKEIDHQNDAEAVIEVQEGILELCGAPKALIASLDAEDFSMLCEEVIGSKKR